MAWTFGSYTIPSGDEPWWDSDYQEIGEDVHSRQHPIGGTGRDSTIMTYMYTKSPTARFHFWCTAATKNDLLSKRKTTFTIADPWAGSASWYMDRIGVSKTGGTPVDPLGNRFHVVVDLVGR